MVAGLCVGHLSGVIDTCVLLCCCAVVLLWVRCLATDAPEVSAGATEAMDPETGLVSMALDYEFLPLPLVLTTPLYSRLNR